jgi:stage III sporulation protein AB
MKIALLVLLFLLPSGYGFFLSNRIQKRAQNLKHFKACIEKIYIQVTEYRSNLEEIFAGLAKDYSSDMCLAFMEISTKMSEGKTDVGEIFYDAFAKRQLLYGFGSQEMLLVEDISKVLANGKMNSQRQYIGSAVESAEVLSEACMRECEKSAGAYRKIGILAGLFLVVVFI